MRGGAWAIVREAIRIHHGAGDSNFLHGIHGPFHNLQEQLNTVGATIDDSLVTKPFNESVIDAWHIPWQHLKPAIFSLSARARTSRINHTRTYQGHIHEVDDQVIRTMFSGLGNKETRILRHIATGGY